VLQSLWAYVRESFGPDVYTTPHASLIYRPIVSSMLKYNYVRVTLVSVQQQFKLQHHYGHSNSLAGINNHIPANNEEDSWNKIFSH
jgi:hypothetical protein